MGGGGHLGEVPCGPSALPLALGGAATRHGNRLLPFPAHSPQFSLCLTIVFLLQLAAGVLGFVFSDKVVLGAEGLLRCEPEEEGKVSAWD